MFNAIAKHLRSFLQMLRSFCVLKLIFVCFKFF
jgi:hypothetical protein